MLYVEYLFSLFNGRMLVIHFACNIPWTFVGHGSCDCIFTVLHAFLVLFHQLTDTLEIVIFSLKRCIRVPNVHRCNLRYLNKSEFDGYRSVATVSIIIILYQVAEIPFVKRPVSEVASYCYCY